MHGHRLLMTEARKGGKDMGLPRNTANRCFLVRTQERTYVLIADSEADRSVWVATITAAHQRAVALQKVEQAARCEKVRTQRNQLPALPPTR